VSRKFWPLFGACALLAIALPARADASIGIRTGGNAGFYFGTRYLVVTAGDTVTWENGSAAEHTVTSYPSAQHSFDSSPQTQQTCNNNPTLPGEAATDCVDAAGGPNDTWAYAFQWTGTYDYYCKVHGDPTFKPNPKLGADQQRCGMCGTIVVKAKPSTPPPATRHTTKPRATKSPSPSPSASPSISPSASPSQDISGSPIASSDRGSGGGGRAVMATVAILALCGAGYAVWRNFLAPRDP